MGEGEFDRVIHERSRLMILTRLASSETGEEDFTALKESLGMTQGNLSVHLRSLEAAGYVSIAKSFVGSRPNTRARLEERGRGALMAYVAEMERLIAAFKGGEKRRETERPGRAEGEGNAGTDH